MKKLLLITSIILLTSTTFSQSNGRVQTAETVGPILRFYPNPATSSITFDFQKSIERGYSLQVYNFLGKKVHEAANLNQRTIVDLTDFQRGVYIYQLYDKTGKLIESGKFQVSK